ncbi:hypothetical protein Aspvir_008465 [Aspergillus viridinutans]|uniref:Nephrocystin 3-like N-terminal domain-containing protein n=1 Tax=Aspergillus viridinutans TaxID=75553 RepID=A0A9P3C1A0_ASPVI|nr:uncharacterized protein Aspvir_008465 [Aspergillus viridinutans]GIK04383.1 hypothetical protein Aspvir_008465 [Aspergillus viridinutans]
MSDSEDSGFVLVDPDDASVGPISKSAEDIANLRDWLYPTAYPRDTSEFKKHLNSHVSGTGEWIYQTPQFRQWLDSSTNSALWIKAVAGAGKSVLTARLVFCVQEESNSPVLFFFCRQIVSANHDPHALVRDWMAQLLDYSPHLQAWVEGLKKEYRRVHDIGFTELWHALLDILHLLKKVFCVVDALDELDSDHADEFLQHLVALGKQETGHIKLLMTSRPLPQIQKLLNTPTLQVRLEDRHVNRDIALFVDHCLQDAVHLSESVRDRIKGSIEDRVHPSFLHARLLIDELLDDHRGNTLEVESVNRTLLALPDSLEDMYSQMLHGHSRLARVPRQRQLLVLQLITHATKPLRLLEVATVLAFLDMSTNKEKHGDAKNLTRMSCGPLLEILEDETVAIILIPTSYLADAFPVIDPEETNSLLAAVCLKYLLCGCLASYRVRKRTTQAFTDPVPLRSYLDHPFLEYALGNWHVHVRRLSKINGELLDTLNDFMRTDNPAYLAWMEKVINPEYAVESITPLHAVSWTGLTNYARLLLQDSHNCNALDKRLRTRLSYAATKGFLELVTLLLQHGAEPDDPCLHGNKPLHYATARFHPGSAPSWRQSHDRQDVRPPTAKETDFSAVMADLCEMVEFLLNVSGIDLATKFGWRCLLSATNRRDYDMMRLLLDRGAHRDTSFPASHLLLTFCQPCTAADTPRRRKNRKQRIQDCFDLVLQTECDVNYQNGGGWTALHYFVESNSPLVERILQLGADVHATDDMGNTPLHLFRPSKASVRTLEALMRYGARWDVIRAKDGKMPLHTCLEGFHADCLDVLKLYVQD